MQTVDVLIVGAGPAGLTLACDLRRRGVNIRLIDQLAGAANASKGKALQPRTLELFDDLGIAGAVLASGRTYPPLRFYDGDKVVREHAMMTIKEPTPEVPYPNTIMLPQWKTEELLRSRLDDLGGQIDYDTAFVSLEQDDQRVVVTVATPAGLETVSARYLVGADGGRGKVRTAVGIRLDGDSPSLEGLLVADVCVDGLDRDHWHFWTNSGMVALCPLPSTPAFQFTARVTPDEQPALDLATLQSIIDGRGGSKLVLRDMTWISLFRPNIRMADRFQERRVFLIGDAAHLHPPTGGQGLNTSVQDAYNLGWKLGAVLKGADPALLESYEEERLPIAASVLGRSELLYRRGLSGDDTAMRRGDDEQQLLLNYRGASHLGPPSPTTQLQPGDRMPNAQLKSKSGSTVNLFDLMRGPHGVVLEINRPAGRAPADPDLQVFTIGVGGATGDYQFVELAGSLGDLAGQTVTVRPDGYIQAIADRPMPVVQLAHSAKVLLASGPGGPSGRKAPSTRTRRGGVAAWVFGGLILLLLTAVGVLVFPHRPSAAQSVRFDGYIRLPKVKGDGLLTMLDYLTVSGDDIYVAGVSTGAVYKVGLHKTPTSGLAEVSVFESEPAAHGVVIDPTTQLGYVTRSEANAVDVFNPSTMQLVKHIPVASDPDAMLYDPLDKLVYAASSDAKQATLIDPASQTVVGVVALGGEPEFAAFDPATRLVYQNLADTNSVVAVDPAKRLVVQRWPLTDCDHPTGMAIDAAHRRLFIACGKSSKLDVFDLDLHRVVASVPVGFGADSVAFDSEWRRIYVTGLTGVLSVVQIEGGADIYRVVDTIHLHFNAHTLAIDPATHRLYVGYASLLIPPRLAVFTPVR